MKIHKEQLKSMEYFEKYYQSKFDGHIWYKIQNSDLGIACFVSINSISRYKMKWFRIMPDRQSWKYNITLEDVMNELGENFPEEILFNLELFK